MSLIDLTGKVGLVTGGSRGIGAATVRLLARAGAEGVFTYHQRASDARKVAEDAAGLARRWTAFQADLAERDASERAVREVVEGFGRLDIFVANAAIWPPEDVGVRDMTDDRWKRTLAVNLDAVFYGVRAALREMGPGGRVVIVSSTAGQRGEAYHDD